MFGGLIRRKAFWMIDFLKGRKVKKELQAVQKAYNDHSVVDEALTNLLTYAIKNVPFYSHIKDPILSNFPVMNKPAFKQCDGMCYSLEFQNIKNLYKASTSGSTGTPLTVYQDGNKRLRHRAEYLFFNDKIGWQLGDHYIFIRNWVGNYKQSLLKNFVQNATNINITDFDDKKKRWLCSHLKQKKHSIIFGYSSAVCDFMNFVKKSRINAEDLFVKLIVCDSDELTKQNKSELEKIFHCPVINRYDNEENGILATTLPNSNVFTVNYTGLYVELLKMDSDEPVKPGEIGRVVVTDLYNHAMPLIRYDLGDLAVSQEESQCKHTLINLAGRKTDCIHSCDGNLISSVAISALTEIFTEIDKYQIIQETNKQYVFKYSGNLTKESKEALMQRLIDCLGKDAFITFENPAFFETGKNGKFKTVINKAG